MAALQVIAAGQREDFRRPCVDCGMITCNFCDNCEAKTRIPSEAWVEGQRTPLCMNCDRREDCCRFCRGVRSCTPPAWVGEVLPLEETEYETQIDDMPIENKQTEIHTQLQHEEPFHEIPITIPEEAAEGK